MGFFKDTAQTALSRFALLVLGVVPAIVLARVLGPSGKGIFALVILVPSLVVALGNFGLGSAGAFHLSSHPENRRKTVGTLLSTGVILSILLVGTILFLYHLLEDSFFADIPKHYLLSALLGVPGILLIKYGSYSLAGLKRFGAFNFSRLLGKGLFLVSLLFLMFPFEDRVWVAVSCWGFGFLIAGIFSIALVWRIQPFPLIFDWRCFSRLISFGIRSHLMLVLLFLNYRIDMFLVKYFSGLEELGLYSVAVSGAELLWETSLPVATVLFIRTASVVPGKERGITPLICRSSFGLALFFAAIMFFASPYLIPLVFSPAFAGAVLPFRVLLPGVAAFCVFNILSSDLSGRGRPGTPAVIALVSVVMNILLNLVLIPRWGLAGAALASDLSYLCATAAIVVVFSRLTGARPGEILILRPSEVFGTLRRIWFNLNSRWVQNA